MEGIDNWRKGRKNNSTDLQLWGRISWLSWDRKKWSQNISLMTDLEQITVGYFLYTEVFASDSKTRIFNRAVDRVRADPQALELLGSRAKIRAFGEPTSNKWSRNRPLA